MEVKYNDSVRQAGPYFTLAERATGQLEQVSGKSAHRVSAIWDRGEDQWGGSVLRLRIQDAPDEAEAEFSTEDLRDELLLRSRLYHLWGDVLQERNHRQFRGILGANGNAGEQHAAQDRR